MKLPAGADWPGPQPQDPRPIYYIGGARRHHIEALYTVPDPRLHFFCISYFYEFGGSGATLESFTKHHSRVFCDSGAFTFLVQAYRKGTSTRELEAQVNAYLTGGNKDRYPGYVPWLRSKPYPFDFYVTLDYRMEAPLVYRVTQRLRKLGLRPVPVYHGDASLSWLQRYIDEGYRLIGISKGFFRGRPGELRKFYDQVFNLTESQGVACHGFACTGADMFRYPWYSVDSTTLVIQSGRGNLLRANGIFVNISEGATGNVLGEETRHQIQQYGLDFETLRVDYKERLKYNARVLAKRLWNKHSTSTTIWQTRRSLIP